MGDASKEVEAIRQAALIIRQGLARLETGMKTPTTAWGEDDRLLGSMLGAIAGMIGIGLDRLGRIEDALRAGHTIAPRPEAPRPWRTDHKGADLCARCGNDGGPCAMCGACGQRQVPCDVNGDIIP